MNKKKKKKKKLKSLEQINSISEAKGSFDSEPVLNMSYVHVHNSYLRLVPGRLYESLTSQNL